MPCKLYTVVMDYGQMMDQVPALIIINEVPSFPVNHMVPLALPIPVVELRVAVQLTIAPNPTNQ